MTSTTPQQREGVTRRQFLGAAAASAIAGTSPSKTHAGNGNGRSNGKACVNYDSVFTTPEARAEFVKAADQLLRMRPIDVFQGLIKTESGGNQFSANGATLKSSSDAYGAAQVLLTTAKTVARNHLGQELDFNRFMKDATYNKLIGWKYFEEQYQDFDNNNVLALLAYNGGPGGLESRIRRYGYPIQNTGSSMIDMISSIQNDENRRYALITMVKLGLVDMNKIGNSLRDCGGTYTAKAGGPGNNYHSKRRYSYPEWHGREGGSLLAGYMDGTIVLRGDSPGTLSLYSRDDDPHVQRLDSSGAKSLKADEPSLILK